MFIHQPWMMKSGESNKPILWVSSIEIGNNQDFQKLKGWNLIL